MERTVSGLLLLSVLTVARAVVPGSATANEINQLNKKQPPGIGGALYPQTSETRDLRRLDGIWNFRKSPVDPEFGYKHGWYEKDLEKFRGIAVFDCLNSILPEKTSDVRKEMAADKGYEYIEQCFQNDLHETGPVIPMPVPASYNDIGVDADLRDHVGLVWYDRRFHVPSWWIKGEQRVWLRFSSVHYAAQVWVNGKQVIFHEIGHLPFEAEITDKVVYNTSNLLTVAVDNTLLGDTLPQGSVRDIFSNTNKIRQEQTYTFDFFNYAGIHRSVFLYSTPKLYIDDVIVNTDIQGLTGFVVYNITYKGTSTANVECLIQLIDKTDTQVAALQDCAGLLEVGNARFWWPYLMHSEPGYLYTFKASLIAPNGEVIDTYSQKIGIRTVTWSNKTIYLNEKPIYLRGFGMHEDSDLRGKGWDQVLWTKNFNLIKWVGANAFRTSHYPYAEEIYQMADENGIMIIDECPGVDTDFFTNSLLVKHKQSLTELIRRDKNHPSVIMWSISNEPRSYKKEADAYFADVVKHVKSMDLSRPVTIAISQGYNNDRAAQHLDVISFNRYNGWYVNTGALSKIYDNLVEEGLAWHRVFDKPVLMSEYGADTLAGLHEGQHLDVICFNRYNGWYKHTGALYDIAQRVEEEATQFHGHNKPVIMTEYGADTIAGLHLAGHIDVILFNRYNGWYHDTGLLSEIAHNVEEEARAWYGAFVKPIIMSEYGADTMPGLHMLPEFVWSEEFQMALMSEHFKAFDKLRRTGSFAGEFIWNFADFKTAQTVTRVGGNKKGIFTRAREPKASAHHLRARYLALAAADSGSPKPSTAYYISDNSPAIHEEL